MSASPNPMDYDGGKLVARDRLFRRLLAAHADNDAVEVMQEEEWVIVDTPDPRWRVFMGFGGFVELVYEDSPVEHFEVNDPLDDDLDWYHHELLVDPVRYALQMLDDSGLREKKAEEERIDGVLRSIGRREVFANARRMAAARHRKATNVAFAMTLHGIDHGCALAICRAMGVEPHETTAA